MEPECVLADTPDGTRLEGGGNWKIMGLFSLSHLLQTDQIIYCQLSQLATSRSFLIVQGATLDAHRCPVVNHHALRCSTKLLPKAVGGKVKISFPRRITFKSHSLFLFLMWKCQPGLKETVATVLIYLARSMPVSLLLWFSRAAFQPPAFVTNKRTVTGYSTLTLNLHWMRLRYVSVPFAPKKICRTSIFAGCWKKNPD